MVVAAEAREALFARAKRAVMSRIYLGRVDPFCKNCLLDGLQDGCRLESREQFDLSQLDFR